MGTAEVAAVVGRFFLPAWALGQEGKQQQEVGDGGKRRGRDEYGGERRAVLTCFGDLKTSLATIPIVWSNPKGEWDLPLLVTLLISQVGRQ